MTLLPVINQNKCNLCGRCVEVCPKDVIQIQGSELILNQNKCMLCSHCYAICPVNAVSFNPDLLNPPYFKTIKYKEKKYPKDPVDIINFLRSRRSIRKYSDSPVSPDLIDDLLEFAVTAPSGSNKQLWEFSVINGRPKVWDLAIDIRSFFIRLNALAENPAVRYLTAPFNNGALIKYYRDHIESVKIAIAASQKGVDLLFHGAPCVIIIHDNNEGSTPGDDAQFAAYNIVMLAHALDLGTCFIGYAVESLNRMNSEKEKYMIPGNNKVRAVLTLGHPALKFVRPSLRKNYLKSTNDY